MMPAAQPEHSGTCGADWLLSNDTEVVVPQCAFASSEFPVFSNYTNYQPAYPHSVFV